ncbi:MAG TPA: NAD(P)-dependent oxidoreductase [Aquihabitans sp.]|nr:NAD(P)-dependent oxidoreductase [Aquihabitans sp.]
MSTVVVTAELPAGGTDPLVEAGLEVVQLDVRSRVALIEAARAADALVAQLTDRIDAAVLDAGGGRLRVVANVAAGYDNIDVAHAARLGVTVCNTPGVLDETTAELAFALALMARRRTSDAERALRAGTWGGWDVNGFLGHDLVGATMGIVGWGRIGRALGRRAEAFGMEVVHTARRPTGEPGQVATLELLLARSDVVSLHVPLAAETRHLIGAAELRCMRPGAVLVNTSRGPVVDEAALAAALHEGTVFGAGIDVYEDEPTVHPQLLDAPGAVLLPHIGSATVATRTAMARAASNAVVDVLAGRTTRAAITSTPTTSRTR